MACTVTANTSIVRSIVTSDCGGYSRLSLVVSDQNLLVLGLSMHQYVYGMHTYILFTKPSQLYGCSQNLTKVGSKSEESSEHQTGLKLYAHPFAQGH